MEDHGSDAKATNPVHIMYLLDETGSMEVVRSGAISAFNEYVKSVKDGENAESAKFTLITFNTETGPKERNFVSPLKDAPSLSFSNYIPKGGTPLYDAIAHAIARADEVSGHDVIMVIHTDGEENSSTHTTREDVSRLIEKRREQGWVFVFLGADQDAWTSAGRIGVYASNTVSFRNTSFDTHKAVDEVAKGTMAYMSASVGQRVQSARQFLGKSTPTDYRKEADKTPRWKTPK